MKFYWVNENYVSYLYNIDNKVFYHPHHDDKRETHIDGYDPRPYIGVLININGTDFIAPLSSPKSWHDDIDKGDNRYLKIYHQKKRSSDYLGLVRLCNMIPINDKVCHAVIFSEMKKIDEKYFFLLQDQYEFLVKEENKNKLEKRAKKIYDISQKTTHVHYESCCKFDLLSMKINDFSIE